MQPTDIFPHIKIVPLNACIAHEGVVPRWVDQIAANIAEQGVMKNPIVVTRKSKAGRQIVIDGMHRFAAFRKLEIRDIVVYEIDYHTANVRLEGWDALLFRAFSARPFLQRLFPAHQGYRWETVAGPRVAQVELDARRALIGALDRSGRCTLLRSRRSITTDRLIQASEVVDRGLDTADLRPVYVPDSLSIDDFRRTRASGLIIRPHYTKSEIIERTLTQRIFPRKSTRHLIPGRPLRVDVNLALLRTRINLVAKNRLLDEHLRWCYASDRIRYYPESVFVFAD